MSKVIRVLSIMVASAMVSVFSVYFFMKIALPGMIETAFKSVEVEGTITVGEPEFPSEDLGIDVTDPEDGDW